MRIRLLPESSPLGWTPFAWLVYLSFFVVYAVYANSPLDWLIDGPALVAFLVLYFRGFWLHGRPLLAVSFGIVAIGLVVAPHNPGASCFFIFAAAFLGDVGRPAVAVRWLLVIIAIVAVETFLFSLSPQFWIPAVVISILVGGSNIHFCEMRRKDRALIKAHEVAEHMATIAERERIARDLHDLLGHTLSIIVLKSELASKVADRDLGRAIREIRDVERISRHALAEVRQAVYGYRGERLEEELTTARTALDAAGVAFDVDAAKIALDPDQERTLSLGLREAVTNVIRHARAGRCRVTLTEDEAGIRLTVEDDGVGGDPAEGAGLSGMRARLAEIGGTMERDARRGTRLTLVVPRRPDVARAMVAS
jgi:two-component system, NarL family, sensor histidine kinase DesK